MTCKDQRAIDEPTNDLMADEDRTEEDTDKYWSVPVTPVTPAASAAEVNSLPCQVTQRDVEEGTVGSPNRHSEAMLAVDGSDDMATDSSVVLPQGSLSLVEDMPECPEMTVKSKPLYVYGLSRRLSHIRQVTKARSIYFDPN